MKKFDFDAVRKEQIDFRQIGLVLRKAEASLASSQKIRKQDPESAFTLAYEGMLKATLALMFSNGYRPRAQLGHHKTLVQYARHVLGADFAGITATYDMMRKKRNRVVYDVGAVSAAEVDEALSMARRYIDVVRQKIEKDNPQLKLL